MKDNPNNQKPTKLGSNKQSPPSQPQEKKPSGQSRKIILENTQPPKKS